MSIDAMNWAWEQENISPTETLVLLALARHCNAAQECWPSFATICRITKLGRSTVIRSIKALEELKLISNKGASQAVKRGGISNLYKLNVGYLYSKPSSAMIPGVTVVPGAIAGPSATVTPTQCHSDTNLVPQRDPNSNRTVIESISAEPQSVSPPVITIPLNDNTEFPIDEKQFKEWVDLFPAVDVKQELRNAKAWCLANPSRRKTKRGVKSFLTGWLTRTQDKPRVATIAKHNADDGRSEHTRRLLRGT